MLLFDVIFVMAVVAVVVVAVYVVVLLVRLGWQIVVDGG